MGGSVIVFRPLVFILLLLNSLTPAHAGWYAGAAGCLASFEDAKTALCNENNPDTTAQPGSAFYRDSCVTTTIPNFVVNAHVLSLNSGSVAHFSYLASISPCTGAAMGPAMSGPVAPEMCQAGAKTAKPVIPATGEEVYSVVDYKDQGIHALELTRYFRSRWGTGVPRDLPTNPGLSRSWAHNFSTSLALEGAPAKVARVLFGDGRISSFTRDSGDAPWTPTFGPNSLAPASGGAGYVLALTDDDSKWLFDTAGKLLTVTQRNGWVMTYGYSTASTPVGVAPGPGLLISVTNEFGRQLNFAYDGSQQLVAVTLPDGGLVTYLYDSTTSGSRLIRVTYPGATGTSSQNFVYENTAFPHLLTGVLDELGNRFETINYDNQGRATSSGLALGADQYNIAYGGANAATVTDPLGTARTYSYGTLANKLTVLGADKPSGTGQNSAASRVQDANGFVNQETDFLGINTMYTWDINRRLPLSTTKAAGQPEVQTVTTQWHPTFRLPVLVTEAGRTTSYTYDTQGNMLTKGVTDTATSVTRTTSWTYGPRGQLATETSPTGAVVGTYAYYADTVFNGIPSTQVFDPDMNAVSLLLHGNGANGSTTFVDSSLAPKTFVSAGTARISTTQSKFGGGSMYFDGSASYLATSTNASFDVGLADFTAEAWYYVNSTTTDQAIITISKSAISAGADFAMGLHHFGALLSGKVRGFIYSGADGYFVDSAGALAENTWYHLAFVRNAGVLSLYVDGVLQGSTNGNFSVNTPVSGWSLFVGRNGDSSPRYLNGYLDEIRFTKGVARYATNFSPPTEAFPNFAAAPIEPNDVGHRVGDLLSIINAAGHVKQFTQYDRAGRVRQMIDPKGVVTDTAYTPRGWISNTTVTPPGGVARTTNFSYDNAGQLTGVVMPDATTLSYSYDAAHRLTGVTDAKGNTVTYALDNMGNKVGEQVKDPQGNLQRNITRVYDALNRVQQTTGASN